MTLGAFSVSLAVKDIESSKTFCETLGFEIFGGDQEQGWLILRNGETVIGLFTMLDGNVLTFNPGWDQNAQPLESFVDVREIQHKLGAADLELDNECDESTSGPASLMVTDPDGNRILFDQHV